MTNVDYKYSYNNMRLLHYQDQLSISFGGTTLDSVSYTTTIFGGSYPTVAGQSLSLSSSTLTSTDNDNVATGVHQRPRMVMEILVLPVQPMLRVPTLMLMEMALRLQMGIATTQTTAYTRQHLKPVMVLTTTAQEMRVMLRIL